MTHAHGKKLPRKWKTTLGLAGRRVPEFYETASSAVGASYASAIRTALEKIGLSAVYCVQGIPTVGIVALDRYDRKRVAKIRAELWNQGLASLLLVVTEDTVRVFSLVSRPLMEPSAVFEKRCLLEELKLTTDALRIRRLIDGAESGRLWNDYRARIPSEDRVDRLLLASLADSHSLMLKQGLAPDAAQALLIQTMLISYLEDRGIATPDYFISLSEHRAACFTELLSAGEADLFEALFERLRRDYDGDLFFAPAAFGPGAQLPELTPELISILARFHSGQLGMDGGQEGNRPYDFAFIPVELISAVHDRFLGGRQNQPHSQGAYFTPMFLADMIVTQIWNALPGKAKDLGRFLDPACGSGIFLVLVFQRLCERWRRENGRRNIPLNTLRELLERLSGWDKDDGAIRLAAFSLHVAFLEEVPTKKIALRLGKERFLPTLVGKTLVRRDFFSVSPERHEFDVVLGNPPWSGGSGERDSSTRRRRVADDSVSDFGNAWAFSWKALSHLRENGVIGFLLPAMGFLHVDSGVEANSRDAFFSVCRIRRIIDLTDLRHQLIEKANRPAAIFLYGHHENGKSHHRFDYWAPKASPDLRSRRVVALAPEDKTSVVVATVLGNPSAFRERMCMREADAKLFAYFSRFPKLGDLVWNGFGKVSGKEPSDRWRTAREDRVTRFAPISREDGIDTFHDRISVFPYRKHSYDLMEPPVPLFTRLALPENSNWAARSNLGSWRELNMSSIDTCVLVSNDIDASGGRLRAAYCNDAPIYRDGIQAIPVPNGGEWHAKLLTTILNSRVSAWCAFHCGVSFGTERRTVGRSDLLRLPFPAPADFLDEPAAQEVADELVRVVDEARETPWEPEDAYGERSDVLRKLDKLAADYFGLSDDEVAMIDDALNYAIPAVQPLEGSSPKLWRTPYRRERACYAETLARRMRGWMRSANTEIGTRLIARSDDLAILRLRLDDDSKYGEEEDGDLTAALDMLRPNLDLPISENFQAATDLRVFSEGYLYLIKPMRLRFWLRTAALSDADDIALEMQDIKQKQRLRSAS